MGQRAVLVAGLCPLYTTCVRASGGHVDFSCPESFPEFHMPQFPSQWQSESIGNAQMSPIPGDLGHGP